MYFHQILIVYDSIVIQLMFITITYGVKKQY